MDIAFPVSGVYIVIGPDQGNGKDPHILHAVIPVDPVCFGLPFRVYCFFKGDNV